nr:hypothetical protein [Nitrospirota bacterium]
MPNEPATGPKEQPNKGFSFQRQKKWLIAGSVVLLLAGLVICSGLHRRVYFLVVPHDTVHVANYAVDEVGVLADGMLEGTSVNSERFTAPTGTDISLGNFTGPPNLPAKAQVIAFTRSRPPTLLPATDTSPPIIWTPGSDTVEIKLEEEYAIQVYVWIVTQTYDTPDALTGVTPLQKAIDANVTTSQIWSEERQGLRFSTYTILDATQNPQASTYSADFTCGDAKSISEAIGNVPGAVNVYYVNKVYGMLDAAVECEYDNPLKYVIALGIQSSSDVLAHEFGHAFSLEHIDCFSTTARAAGCPIVGATYFDQTNVMHGASISRKGLTEGQTFRAIFNKTSAINTLYYTRQGLLTTCANSTVSINCPPVQKRIWEDLGEQDQMGNTMHWPPN